MHIYTSLFILISLECGSLLPEKILERNLWIHESLIDFLHRVELEPGTKERLLRLEQEWAFSHEDLRNE